MALKPASISASSKANDVASSAVQPKTLPPKISGGTAMPLLPRGFLFIGISRTPSRVCMLPASTAVLGGQIVAAGRAGRHSIELLASCEVRIFTIRQVGHIDRYRVETE